MAGVQGRKLLSPFILAELDYMLSTRRGLEAQTELLTEVERGAYSLEPFGPQDVRRARQVMEQYADLNVGLADASVVVLAERHDTLDVLTLDQLHFRVLEGPGGQPFRLLPADV